MQCYTVVVWPLLCWAAEECNALGLTPCPSLLPAVSQAGSQTTSHQRGIDEWWDLEGMHNKKEGRVGWEGRGGGCYDSEH